METASHFELLARGIPEERWARSIRIRAWVLANYSQHYVPEFLLRRLGIDPDTIRVNSAAKHERGRPKGREKWRNSMRYYLFKRTTES